MNQETNNPESQEKEIYDTNNLTKALVRKLSHSYEDHYTREGQQLVKRESLMVNAAGIVELHHRRFAFLFILRHVRRVQLAQSIVERGQAKSLSGRLRNRIPTTHGGWNTLIDEPPQAPPTEPAEASIHRHDPFRLVPDLLDLRIDELERSATCLPHLPVKIKLGFVGESPMDPPLVEPYDLEISVSVIDESIDDQHSAPWYSAHLDSLDASTKEHPRTWLEASAEPGEPGAILVTTGQMEQQIEHRPDALRRQLSSAFRTDAFEFCQKVAGEQICSDRGQSLSISKRHWMVPKTTVSPFATGTDFPATRRTPLTKVPFIVPTSSITA